MAAASCAPEKTASSQATFDLLLLTATTSSLEGEKWRRQLRERRWGAKRGFDGDEEDKVCESFERRCAHSFGDQKWGFGGGNKETDRKMLLQYD